MSVRRVAGLAAIAAATVLWVACGQVYRPVVIPVAVTPPNPQNFHAVFGISTNVGANPGTALQIDVSGDSDIGQANMGVSPTHVGILPNDTRIFVASAGTLFPGESDIVTAFSPAADSRTATGLGTPMIFAYPNVGTSPSSTVVAISESGNLVTVTLSAALSNAVAGAVISVSSVNVSGYNGNFLISSVNGPSIQYMDSTAGLAPASGGMATVPTTCSYLPDYVTTAQSSAVFVANYGVESNPNCNLASTDSVALLSPAYGSITNIGYLPPGSHPVAMAETPNAQNLYVVNQGTNSVQNVSPTDLSTIANILVDATPVWVVARIDNQRVYVLTQGGGTLVPIDTVTNTILPSQTNLSVGAGANFLLYDSNLNRLYVTNPTTGTVFVYSATGGVDLSGNPNDTPLLLATISMSSGTNPPCPGGCSPVSVAALPDGSRFYVASYASSTTTCPDPNVGATPCIIPMLTVFNAAAFTVETPPSTLLSAPSLSLLTSPQFGGTQYAVPPVTTCVTPATYTPGTTRFRMFTTASQDGSHVYVSICDAGTIADINTSTTTIAGGSTNAPDSLITDLAAPPGACAGACPGPASITSFSINSGVVTFQAVNTFTAGTQVEIAGLSTAAGAPLNSTICNVLASGLSATPPSTQFECVEPSLSNVGATADSGTAVPQAPAQAPIFLLTGQ
ncbi:MAG TPA: hypothetical protein VMD76_06145 [Candidatus Sulfotelmatobacter sp.]|nr:hypothetical protein [Candidatus Sulfotelmatobacter sp.]